MILLSLNSAEYVIDTNSINSIKVTSDLVPLVIHCCLQEYI